MQNISSLKELFKRDTKGSLAEFMMSLTYKINDDHDMAVRLMRLADKLSDLDALFGTRWERDFDSEEKKLVNNCFALMEKQNASS
jgi:hypothetical protein